MRYDLTLLIRLDGPSLIYFRLPTPFTIEVKLVEIAYPVKIVGRLSGGIKTEKGR